MGPAPWQGTGTSPSPTGEKCRRTWPRSCWGPKISSRQCHMPRKVPSTEAQKGLYLLRVSIQHRVALSRASLGQGLGCTSHPAVCRACLGKQ